MLNIQWSLTTVIRKTIRTVQIEQLPPKMRLLSTWNVARPKWAISIKTLLISRTRWQVKMALVVAVQTWNPNTWDAEARGPGLQGKPWLQSEFKETVNRTKPFSKRYEQATEWEREGGRRGRCRKRRGGKKEERERVERLVYQFLYWLHTRKILLLSQVYYQHQSHVLFTVWVWLTENSKPYVTITIFLAHKVF